MRVLREASRGTQQYSHLETEVEILWPFVFELVVLLFEVLVRIVQTIVEPFIFNDRVSRHELQVLTRDMDGLFSDHAI